MLDFMMWVTVLGCLIISSVLAWGLARTINYPQNQNRAKYANFPTQGDYLISS